MRGESEAFLVAVISVCLLADCSFEPTVLFNLIPSPETPVATPTEGTVNMVYEDPGTIVVFHGYACAESDRDGEEVRLRLKQELKLPAYAVSATVLLNGWRVSYLYKDHHFTGFGTAIYGISRARDTLTWEAAGILSDKNFDDAYRWCYRYTVLGWNPAALLAVVDHADPDHIMISQGTDTNNTTALMKLSGFLPVTVLPARAPISVLPRGYGVSYGSVSDHHLLQLAYNLDYSEKFAEQNKKYAQLAGTSCCTLTNPSLPTAANYAEGFVTWDSKTIFKDNDLRRDYVNAELVSALGGADVGVIQPPFTILPREDAGLFTTCVGGSNSPVTHDVVTEEVPFEYAVPMLTGWELAYGCDDHHVRDMGAWIERFSYTRPSGGAGGTLRHSVSTLLRDNDSNPAASTFRAHILGFKRIGSKGTPAPPTVATKR